MVFFRPKDLICVFNRFCSGIFSTFCSTFCSSKTLRKTTILYFFLLFIVPYSFSQNSLPVTDTLVFSSSDKSLSLSHKNLVPFSESLKKQQKIISENLYSIDYQKGMLSWVKENTFKEKDTLLISYRFFTQNLPDTLALKQQKIIEDSLKVPNYYAFDVENNQNNLQDYLDDSRLKKSGSITRGLTVGSAQGTTITSGMRMQLEGDLGDGLQIVGSITDDNLPIQPDGTTQQISDFDKVFIQLKKYRYSLTIGDYEVQQKGTRYADLYRNVQGLRLGYDGKNTHVSVSGAVAKGKFHSNSITGIDAVMGPYYLTGKSGEKFFTILAGSEKVYLNGKLMVRGENNDYVMDYNTAQLTFTAKNVITNISRIVVDFEYTDRYFNRSLVFATAEHQLLDNKANIKFSYGRDADNPNAPFDNKDAYFAVRDSLAAAGDATNGIVYTSGIIADSFYKRTQAYYIRQDTVINGVPYPRYIYTTDSLSAEYRIFFTFVGAGNGYYKRDISGYNQYVYKWTAPDIGGNLTGDYAPVKTWILPKKLETYNLIGKWQITKKAQFYMENALSNEDKNLLSSKDDNDNLGFANLTGIKFDNIKLRDSLLLSTDVSGTYVAQKFNNLDRVYKAEYGRQWNFNDLGSKRYDETIGSIKNTLDWKGKLKLQTENAVRSTGNGRLAVRQVYGITSNLSKSIRGTYTYTNILAKEDSIQRNSLWQRHEGDIFYTKWGIKLGTEIWIEKKNEKLYDTLANGSFEFYDLKPYIRRMSEDKKLTFDFSFNYRYDKAFLDNQYRQKSRAFTHYYKIAYNPIENIKIQNITSYRMLDILDTAFLALGQNANRALNENLQFTGYTKNRVIYGNFIYEVSSEQVAQRDVLFLAVNPGQGEYQWIDSNNDNIQNINEFVLSTNPLQANFIRVVLPTQRFVPSTKPALQANIRFDFKKLYEKSKNPFKETVRNFKSFSTLRVSQNKERANNFSTYWVHFQEKQNDTSLIDMNANFRQEFTFFQNSVKGDLKIAYQKNQTKQFLSTGTETRGTSIWTFSPRFSLASDKSVEMESNVGQRFTRAINFPARNFNIHYFDMNPKINWQASRKLRFSAGYTYKNKRNFNDSLAVNSTVQFHKIVMENRWNIKNRNNLNTKLELISIAQKNVGTGPAFTANYELLESLQPGFNAVWQVFLTYYIFKDLEMSVTYEGRAAAKQTVIHTGRVQVRALF